jgi:hypothetical protein
VITDTLQFFDDEGGGEEQPGVVDYIRTYNTALSSDEVKYLAEGGSIAPVGGVGGHVGAVPEPATWAMMLFGFFSLGGALRARRRGDARQLQGVAA